MIEQLRKRLLDREHPVRIHLIGVAGAGMSGLARMLLEMGHRVSGCDRVTSTETEKLQQAGLVFSCPHSAESVQDAEIIIYSSAIREENVALAAARKNGSLCLRRAECLAAILNNKKGVVVAGTHGKTTTSAMSAHLLREGRMRPCHYVGAEIPVLGANAHWNEDSEYLVAEGDESDGTLVNYIPEHSIILNIEAEHLDFYRDLEHIKSVFHRLCRQTRGKLIYCKNDAGAHDVCSQYPNTISYGWQDADYTATDMTVKRGRTLYTINYKGEALGRVELGIPGRHNVLNSLAATALALELGCDFASITRGLVSFAGARRRFETKYLSRQYRIVDDYGHHPTEIAATLQTAQSLKPDRLIVLFQPHRYTRTQLLRDDFGKVLQNLDKLYVADVYPASEPPIPGISGQTIVDAVQENGPVDATFLPNLPLAHHVVGNTLRPGDMFITLGAGNVHEAGAKIAADLRILAEMQQECGEDINYRLYEPMSKHTTMGVGGEAQYWIEPNSFEKMQSVVNFFKDRNIPVHIIGRGSNVIVREGGIRGAVIHPACGEFEKIELKGRNIVAGAGVKLKKLAAFAAQNGIAGFEWMDGIPGYVGGSLRMNAGAMGGDMWSVFRSAVALNEDGDIVEFEKENMKGASYRRIPEFEHNMVMQATFCGTPDDAQAIADRMEASRTHRKTTQPLAPSAGCTFVNPAEIPAGKLIDEMGLKGFSIGGAQVSEVHANFIVNKGGAKATDITELIDYIRNKAKTERGITMHAEVQVIGDREPQF
ncbi:MAG: UDP-N-acetylmuramate--L-alanine ligase [Akkermansia sp.]|nr:UDP-N-acetylmuramate--L-alanine ligase [Akkermansia sp.]MBR5876366.1 UDP-N-acetylmuramate--L-alanine ligase [Akkermansia sp.]